MKTELIISNIVLDIEYDYSPEEAMVMYYSDGSGYPGCPASVDVYNVYVNGADITELLSQSTLEEIEEKLLDYHDEQ